MFRCREKLKYMFFGAVLTLVGFLFGQGIMQTQAQLGSETIEKLTVRELEVLNRIVVKPDNQEPLVVITSDAHGGAVVTYSSGGESNAGISFGEDEAVITLTSPSRESQIGIAAHDTQAGIVFKYGSAGAMIQANEQGGSALFRAADESLTKMVTIHTKDGGEVNTLDRWGAMRTLD